MPSEHPLRDEVETVIRGWDAHERARGARTIIDYDFAPTGQPVAPASSRLDVYERLTHLHDRAQADGAERITTSLTAYLAYLRAVLGERPPLEQYVQDTQGCTTAGWSPDYVTEIGHQALEAIAGQGVS